MKRSYYIIIVSFIFFSDLLYCQSNLIIGQWKSHLSYKEGRKLTQTPEEVIYAAERGIFTIAKDDISIGFLSKEDGLTDISVNQLHYDKTNGQLIIIYSDNTIDILKNGEIVNIPFIKTNTTILGSKTINDMFIAESGESYLATDFGILGFDLKKLEFTFTTFTELKILSVAMQGGILYAGTEEGMYAVATRGTNISDFNVWKSLSTASGLPQSFDVKSLAVKFNSVFALIDNTIYRSDAVGNFTAIYTPEDFADEIKYISDDGSLIMVGVERNNNSRTMFIGSDNKITQRGTGCINRGTYAVEDEKGRVWYADEWDPIRYTEGRTNGDCKRLEFPVPYSNEASNIKFKKNKAYFASGGVNDDYQYKFTRYGFYTLDDNEWKNFNHTNIPFIAEKEFFHLLTLAPHPKNDEVYLGSYYSGIISYNEVTKETKHWSKDNSILGGVLGDEARTRIAGLTFDKNDNLWISNFGAAKPLAVKTKDDTWHNFTVPGATALADIVIDNEGNKWIAVVGIGGGVLVFNEGSKIADPTDDKFRFITRNNSEIKGNKVNSLTVDQDGSVWVGTDQGPVVFDCNDPFNESCMGNLRKVVVDDIPALLLRDEDILSIEVDGGNRKWFGTRNGIFVQSPDGITQEAKFDIKNSPLLDNKVTDLAFNGVSGEMFIVTPKGIQSYKTETTSGVRTHTSAVYAYPNPVRPDYNGPIAIKGLVRDANVKITDINGKLVYETKALGGQAIWDGNDYNGVRASTGVYLVFSANENVSAPNNAYVTKILIVN